MRASIAANLLRPALAPVVFILVCGCARLPQITADEIIFAGGESLRYQGAAPVRGDTTGVRQARLEEQPVVLRRLSRLVMIRRSRFSEGGTVKVSVYDFHGRLLGSSEEVATDVPGLYFLELLSKLRVEDG